MYQTGDNQAVYADFRRLQARCKVKLERSSDELGTAFRWEAEKPPFFIAQKAACVKMEIMDLLMDLQNGFTFQLEWIYKSRFLGYRYRGGKMPVFFG